NCTLKSQLLRMWDELRQRLVFTPEEKRVIAFVIAALLLGLGTKCYRDKHPHPTAYADPQHPSRKVTAPLDSPTPKPRRVRKAPAKTQPPPHAVEQTPGRTSD